MEGVVYPVILSGGAGTRLWPLSRALYPKQLLALASDASLLQETVRRASGERFAAPLVICNQDHRFIIAEQLRALGLDSWKIVLEPEGRNTAPALAVAALLLAKEAPEAAMLVLPSDHVIADTARFHGAVATALEAAGGGALATFGIPPTRPETGYGYIQRGERAGAGWFKVARFVEKPDLETARRYLDDGTYDWNSGMFLFPVAAYLAELERLKPGILESCRRAVENAVADLDFLRIDGDAFAECESVSVDYAVMEHTDKAVVVPVEMGWSDVGSWAALWDLAEKDAHGNALVGDVIAIDTTDSFIQSDHKLVAAVGLDKVVAVATDDAVLVMHRDRAQDVRKVVEMLERGGRTEHTVHSKVYRPWGSYQNIDVGHRFQVKHIIVKPGAKLSLQLHHKRAEHWVVVSGTASVTRGEETFLLPENQSTYIPIGMKHALENPGDSPLHLIEVQSGDYLGEDDIVRFEDRYGRAPVPKK